MEKSFVVECNVCGRRYENWTGSTLCCGSIAWVIEDGKATNKLSLFAQIGNEIKPTIVKLNKH